MNQIFFFTKKLSLLFAIVACFGLATNSARGQTNFGTGNFESIPPSSSSSWNAPQTQMNGVVHASHEVAMTPSQPPRFPSSPQEFNATPITEETTDTNSIDGSIDAAAATLSQLKDGIVAKSSGFFDSMNGESGWMSSVQSIIGEGDIGRMLGSLSLVLGGYFALVWFVRRLGGDKNLPTEVLEVVGHAPFGPRQNLQLVRLGSKLLLLMNGPEGTHPIGEITDPDEVEHLISLCSGKRSTRTRSFSSSTRNRQTRAQTNINIGTDHQSTNLTDVLRALDSVKANNKAVFEV